MPPALLDVNVLVALFDQRHIHNEQAHTWFAANRSDGWATCPLTENGLVRILSNFAYAGVAESADGVRDRLAASCADAADHVFWPDLVSLRDERVDLTSVSHGQLTDLYLLALAVESGGRLATFDARIGHLPYARKHPDALTIISF